MFESIAFLIFFSILKNLANENQSSVSFLSIEKKEFEIEKKVVFIFCFFVCVFVNSWIENLFVFIFFVFELSLSIFYVKSFAFLNSKKCEIIREKKRFLDEKIVIKNYVSNFCETNNSNSSSLNESYVKTIEIEEEKEKRRNRFWFKFFAIDFALNCFHVNEIENLWSVVFVIEKIWKYQKVAFKKKRKEKMFFEIFN
jgi:hypothetical protein